MEIDRAIDAHAQQTIIRRIDWDLPVSSPKVFLENMTTAAFRIDKFHESINSGQTQLKTLIQIRVFANTVINGKTLWKAQVVDDAQFI